MEAVTWKCTNCPAEGTGNLPDECPDCTWSCELTQEGYVAAFRMSNLIHERAQSVSALLGHGYSATIDHSDLRPDSTFTIRWTSKNCGHWNCPSEDHEESVPARYLWMSNEAIQAEIDAKKVAAEAKAAEEKRKKELADAGAALARAQARATTAATEAAQALVAAQAKLAALQGGAS